MLPDNPTEAANFLLTLCHLATYLLSRQIKSLEEKFVKEGGLRLAVGSLRPAEGGYSENLLKKRLNYKIR